MAANPDMIFGIERPPLIGQRTEAWFMKRAGKFTGSRFCDLMARSVRDGKPLKCYHDLIDQLVVERLTGCPIDGPSGFALAWGTQWEDKARETYELKMNATVILADFIDHPTLPHVGVSPDGLIDVDGGLELKCPADSRNHLKRFYEGCPDEYKWQVQGQMWASGRQWWHFASFDPRAIPSMQLYVQHIERDEDIIGQLAEAVDVAEKLVQEKLAQAMDVAKKCDGELKAAWSKRRRALKRVK